MLPTLLLVGLLVTLGELWRQARRGSQRRRTGPATTASRSGVMAKASTAATTQPSWQPALVSTPSGPAELVYMSVESMAALKPSVEIPALDAWGSGLILVRPVLSPSVDSTDAVK